MAEEDLEGGREGEREAQAVDLAGRVADSEVQVDLVGQDDLA